MPGNSPDANGTGERHDSLRCRTSSCGAQGTRDRRLSETDRPDARAYGGRFLVHGGNKIVLEGDWPGDLIVIAFPDMERARAWYESPAYRAILPLRTDNAEGAVILAEGVGDDHKATDVLRRMTGEAAA
jgi:uncharacterized protein (DUF1330 family)